jgi:hypothetical protein
VARVLDAQKDLTRTGQIVGTPGFMAPEQARGEKSLDPRADLFALGCVLYRAITGRLPFDGEDVLSVLAKLVLDDPPRLRALVAVPVFLDELVFRMMRKDRGERPASAREVREALERGFALASSPDAEAPTLALEPATPAQTVEVRASNRARRAAIGAGIAIAIAIAAAIGIAVSASMPEDGDPQVLSSADRAIATRACRVWSRAIAASQRPDGSFGLERHRQGFGWTTGQELYSLAHAADGCGAPMTERSRTRGLAALERFRTENGYEGVARGQGGESAATAWALLALSETEAEPAHITRALALLLASQHDDGGFTLLETDRGPSTYPTVLALWALSSAAPADARASEARRSAADWVRARLRARRGLREIAGLSEQAVFALWRARSLEDDPPATDRALFADLARTMIARCAYSTAQGRCTRPFDADGEFDLLDDPQRTPNFRAFWLPWSMLTSYALASDRALGLDPELVRGLLDITRSALRYVGRAMELLSAAPAYQLSEYLHAATEIAASPP